MKRVIVFFIIVSVLFAFLVIQEKDQFKLNYVNRGEFTELFEYMIKNDFIKADGVFGLYSNNFTFMFDNQGYIKSLKGTIGDVKDESHNAFHLSIIKNSNEIIIKRSNKDNILYTINLELFMNYLDSLDYTMVTSKMQKVESYSLSLYPEQGDFSFDNIDNIYLQTNMGTIEVDTERPFSDNNLLFSITAYNQITDNSGAETYTPIDNVFLLIPVLTNVENE